MSTAWSVWKDIGYPGTVHVPGEGGRVVKYTFTPDDWRRIVSTGKRKVADGWNIPGCWEHQDVGPKRRLSQNPLRDHALGVFSSVVDFELTPSGGAKALIAGDDPKDFEQLKKLKFVSPELTWDWTDTDGKLWPGPSVTHLAATARPVQRHQHPVGADPDAPHPRLNSLEQLVRMSLPGGSNSPRVRATLRLSIDHYQTPAGGARPMADEPEGTAAEPAKKMTPWEKIAAALSAHCGIQLGDVSTINTPEEFARIIEVAAMNYKAGSEPDVPEEEPLEEEDLGEPAGDLEAPPEGSAAAPGPPVQLSVTAQNKPLVDRIVAEERAKLVARAEKVRKGGALAPADADALVAECKKVSLSLTSDLKLARTETQVRLEMAEKVKAGATVNTGPAKTRLSQTKAPGKPKNAAPVEPSQYQEEPAQDEAAILAAWDET